MDFVRLGPAYSTAYIPDKIIEGYNSLIWTERHQDPGEFELKSYDVDGLSALLPEDTLVSHLETDYVMMVESQSIEDVGEGVDAIPEITIKGRSADVILEHRGIESTYQKKRRMRQSYSATGAALVLMYQAVDNASGKDVTRGDKNGDTPEVNDYSWTTLDAIPNVVVTEDVAVEGATRGWWLEQGPLLPQLQAILSGPQLGVRVRRPILPNIKTVITVDSALATRGTIRRTATSNVQALAFDVYDGVDRTATVKFSLLQGHMLKPEYLTSFQNYKSGANMISGTVSVADVYRPGESMRSGWQRRMLEFDAGTPEIPAKPPKPTKVKSSATQAQKHAYAVAYDKWLDKRDAWLIKKAGIIADFRSDQTAAALAAMKKDNSKVNMFAGDISDLSPYRYREHYGLGDLVTVVGDYGKTAQMVVHEHVRTEDSSGDHGYPGLLEPDV